MDSRALCVVALLAAVALAGCPGGGGEEIVPGDPTTTPAATPDDPAPPGEPPATSPLGWQIVRVTGDNEDGQVQTLTVIVANLSNGRPLTAENAAVILNHDGDSTRFSHAAAVDGDAAGQFTTDRRVTNTTLERNRYQRVVEFRVDLPPERALAAGETAEVLVTSPNVTTNVVSLVVPERLDQETAVILGGEFAGEDRRPESQEAGVPQVVSATASNVTAAGAGVIQLTVTKLPGSEPIDYRNVTLLWTRPGEAASFVHTSRNPAGASGHFGLTPVRDADGSAPVLTDGDRFRLTLDRGPNNTALDDGPAGTSVGERLPPNATARLQIASRRGETRFLWLRLPTERSAEPVALDGVVPKDAAFPRTNQRPVLRVTSADDQRTDNGSAVTGLGVGIRKPPTADPIDPRTLTVTVETPRERLRLVHPSRPNASADGHFGLETQFNPDGSAPILDDHFDFAVLHVDFGPDTESRDDGPLGDSVGETVAVGSVVTVTVETEGGATATRAYRVRE